MARGFWTGLGHGGALSAGVLVLLALAWPLPRPGSGTGAQLLPGEAAAPDVAAATLPAVEAKPDIVSEPDEGLATATPTAAPPVVDPPAASGPAATPSAAAPEDTGPATAAASDTATAPEAQAVGLPVGSEFGRGSDVAPRLPAPLTAPDSGLRQSDAPAVSAPAAEPLPVAITGTPERPEAVRSQPDAPRPASVDDAPGVGRPPAADLPGFAAAPGLVAGSDRDAAPLTLPEPMPAVRSDPESDAQPETAAATSDLAVSRPDLPAVAVKPAPEPSSEAATRPEATASVPASAGSGQRETEVVEAPRAAPAAPGLRSPALDLSLPPDLSDLRRGAVASE